MITYKINGMEITRFDSETDIKEPLRDLPFEEKHELASFHFDKADCTMLSDSLINCYRILWDYVNREANEEEARQVALDLCVEFEMFMTQEYEGVGSDIPEEAIDKFLE